MACSRRWGLILSLVAVGRQPRGLAVAGIVLGVLGSCGILGILLMLAVGGIGILAAMVGFILVTEGDQIEITRDMAAIALMVDQYQTENRYLPADLDSIDARPSTLMDPWGGRYSYLLTDDEMGFDLVSAGPGRVFGDEDDVALSRLDELWEIDGASVRLNGGADGGQMTLILGDRTLTLSGDETGGQVVVSGSGQSIEIVGDADGGRVLIQHDVSEGDAGTTTTTAGADSSDAPTADEPPTGDGG